MARHVDAWMDGIRLADLGAILIQEVNEPAADQEITYGNRPGRAGRDVLVNKRRLLKVTIGFAIRELFNLSKRREILQAVAGWASGSILELSNHPGQQLHVQQKSAPSLGSVRDYTQVMNIEFEASVIPFWEEKVPATYSMNGTSGSGTMHIPGTVDQAPVELTFTPSGTLTSLTVTASCKGVTQQIALTGMSVTGPVVFGRDSEDRLTIKTGNTSLMRYRTQASADDLLIPCGLATVSFSANVTGATSFSARGRWL